MIGVGRDLSRSPSPWRARCASARALATVCVGLLPGGCKPGWHRGTSGPCRVELTAPRRNKVLVKAVRMCKHT